MTGERGPSIRWNTLLNGGGITITGTNCTRRTMVEIATVSTSVYFVKSCICILCICDANGTTL